MPDEAFIICQECGVQNSPDARYCDKCGIRVDSGSMPCPRCQHANKPDSSYCYRCGLPLDDESKSRFRSVLGSPPQEIESIPGSQSIPNTQTQTAPGDFWSRFAANFLDGIVVTVGNVVIYVLFGENYFRSSDPESPFVFADLISLVFWLTYAPAFIALWSTTVGKRICELYVVRVDGGRCGFWRAFGRELAKFLSALILGVGFLMIAFRSDKRGLHDLIAGTVVIERDRA